MHSGGPDLRKGLGKLVSVRPDVLAELEDESLEEFFALGIKGRERGEDGEDGIEVDAIAVQLVRLEGDGVNPQIPRGNLGIGSFGICGE